MTDIPNGPMAILDGIAGIFTPDRCRALAPALSRTIHEAHGEPGKAKAEQIMIDFAAQIHALAGMSAAHRENMQVNPACGHADVRDGLTLASSDQPETVSTEDAAKDARVCARTMRRWIDEGLVDSRQDHRGAPHHVYKDSLAAYLTRRRAERKQKAA